VEGRKKTALLMVVCFYDLGGQRAMAHSILWWVDPGWMPGAHQSCSITSPPQLEREKKRQQKACGSILGQRKITKLPSRAKPVSTWGKLI